ncbi:MAG: mechanosensitive ion channel [Desulfosarcina sp.]|nr:mechanosensitive ion channel [Desulfosarcina sp.]MBC2767734.1 mechanosensitive ion channel [Desulfosarcina sp.]
MYVQSIIDRLQSLGEVMTQHGTRIALSLAILITGLILIRWFDKALRNALSRLMPARPFVTTICHTVYILMVMTVIAAAATEFGAKPINVLRFLSIITLAAVGLIIFLRPFFPSMPFKVGNIIKAGDLLGIVEAITFLNTRLRTYDGKIIFVPNRKIVDDFVINYHLTPTRRVKIDVGICYDQDLQKAKQVLVALMIEDPRVKTTPSPVVHVLNLASSCVELGGRCWVDNDDWWVTRCDLFEKTKHQFDCEGIQFAFPQLELHYNPGCAHIADPFGAVAAGDDDRLIESPGGNGLPEEKAR